MSAKRWTSDEELKLIQLYSNNKDIKSIASTLDRSDSAIQLRIEKIVFDNIAKGKSPSYLSKALKTDEGNITQMFYTHKTFKQKGGEKVDHVNINTTNNQSNNNQSNNQSNNNQLNNQSNNNQFNNNQSNNNQSNNQLNNNQSIMNQNNKNMLVNVNNQSNNNQLGGNEIVIDHNTNNLHESLEQKLKIIEYENKLLKAMVDNYHMKKELSKLYKDKKLDKTTKKIFKSKFIKK